MKLKISSWSCSMILSSIAFVGIGVAEFMKINDIVLSIGTLLFNLYFASKILEWGLKDIEFEKK
jgi:hypothetical protein